MAAIMIVLILMIVISITVLGFAKIIRREQQSALNDHLSSRAFYAAESGLNMAKKALSNPAVANAYTATPKTSCGTDVNITNLVLDTSTQTEVTCLTIDPSQSVLLYNVSQDHSQSVPLRTNANMSSLTITWQSTSANSTTNYGSCSSTQNLAYGSWGCEAPLLRIDLVPWDAANLARFQLTNWLFTAFLRPHDNGNTTTSTPYDNTSIQNNQGTRVDTIHCNNAHTPYHCSVTISNLFNGFNARTASLRIATYYRDALVSVTAADSTGAALSLSGAQATIDSTGRAFDVVQRVQARVPLTSDFAFPDAGIQSTAGICKVYQITPSLAPYVSQDGTPATFALDPNNTCL